MKNKETWRPTKIVHTRSGFKPSSNEHLLNVASRLTTSCQIEHYQDAIRRHASGRLVDMGCGHVPYYEMYRPFVQDTICVDWANSVHRNELLDCKTDLNNPLPFAPESFDTVLLTDVLEHISRPAELISEIQRILSPSGKVILAVPFLYWLHEQPYDFFRYTEFALRELCEEAGLRILSLVPYGGAPEILVDITAKCLAPRVPSLCRIYMALASTVLKTRPFRSISHKTAKLFPLGYVVVASKQR